MEPAKVLTIAGSDSGGAAGLQADLKTFTALGVYGMSAITVVTAQNSVAVTGVHSLPPSFIARQIETVLADYGAAAVKTGFIGSVALVEQVAASLQQFPVRYKVIDPVLVDHRGESMFEAAVTQAYREALLPLADLVTPNAREAKLLTGVTVKDVKTARHAAAALRHLGAHAVLVTGLQFGNERLDLLATAVNEVELLRAPHIETANTHGSGDTLSAAIAAYLAQGHSLMAAARLAHAFTQQAIRGAQSWRLGEGHGPLNHFVAGRWNS